MCGIAGIFGAEWSIEQLQAMVAVQAHRGPDDSGVFTSESHAAALGHRRLSIIDLRSAARQPMCSANSRYWIVFNGEIYNYRELRSQLCDYPYRTRSDTEVLLAAYERWGESCLDRLIGMFAFLIWDDRDQRLFAARDRFGVKPLYYGHASPNTLIAASEIKALHAAGVPRNADEDSWADFLSHGTYPHQRTFWKGILELPAGHSLTWDRGQIAVSRWYDLAAHSGLEFDLRSDEEVSEEYLSLLSESIQLRFRSDVPVGINLSGGLDSSLLFALVQRQSLDHSAIKAFSFYTGDADYDELPWVERMLAGSRHPSISCKMIASEVPDLATRVQSVQDEPYGGMPTLAYARLFTEARAQNVTVLLDGQGMDEQWAGYDYYKRHLDDSSRLPPAELQGTSGTATRPHCLTAEFRALAQDQIADTPFPDSLRNAQYRDLCRSKLPRALRFNDRISMMAGTELREPFLDHRLVELALRQPPRRKINGGTHKWLLRQLAAALCPQAITSAVKRPLQTPQREWLRGPLSTWADDCIAHALQARPEWFDVSCVHSEWQAFREGRGDNSFFIWQWISVAMCLAA